MLLLPRLLLALNAVVVIAEKFNPLHHSGPASPYFDAPSQDGIAPETPDGCVVDQAAYILRHGSRFPEPGSFAGWQALFAKIQNATFTARGPLAFLSSWVPPVDDVPHEPLFLTSTGALESFSLGVRLRQQYGFTKGGGNLTVWSASQQRVLDTASYFLRGYLSQGNYLSSPSLNRGTIISLPDSVNFTFANSLTNSAACPNYAAGNTGAAVSDAFRATFRPQIAERVNRFLDGLELDATDVGVMQDLCGFQDVINGDTRFCDVFEESEWLDYEYAHDLNYYYGSGPGNPIAAATGFPLIKAISDLFESGPGVNTSSPLIMGFTHDNNVPPLIAALGLWNDSQTSPLDPLRPDARRHFRSSFLVSFRGTVALERLSCLSKTFVGTSGAGAHSSGKGTSTTSNAVSNLFVRVRANNAPIAIHNCTSGPGASCPLAKYLAYVRRPRAKASGDFVMECGLEGVGNASSDASFFVRTPEEAGLVVLPVQF